EGTNVTGLSRILLLIVGIATLARPTFGQNQGQQVGQNQPPQSGNATRASTSPPSRDTTIFYGGVPSGTVSTEIITITVVDALRRALQYTLGVLTAEQQVGRAEGTRWRALSDLLPNISAQVTETRQQRNLAAFGFPSFSSPFGTIPSIVGPFNNFDAR